MDRETKITHEQFASQIEARLGYGEGDNAKGPDMKVWSKGRGLNEVSLSLLGTRISVHIRGRWTGNPQNSVIPQSFNHELQNRATT